jgi:hypothetical protein
VTLNRPRGVNCSPQITQITQITQKYENP